MGERNSDIVILNVGGTFFTSSIATLVSSSSYFERRLSDEWREQSPSGEEQITIDHDPRLFSILLSYMRLGSIDADKLTTPVILLAVFFGMDELLEAIRAVAIRSKFEGRSSSLFSAAQGAMLVRESDIKKEFASLTICHPDYVSYSQNRGVDSDFVAFVEIQDGKTTQVSRNCYTFIDALNVLSKSGYTRYEREQFEPNQSYGASIARMWFSKLLGETSGDTVDNGDRYNLPCFASEAISIMESDRTMPKKYPREFCYVLDNEKHGDELGHLDLSVLEADTGNEKSIELKGHLELVDENMTGTVTSIISRSAVLETIDTKIMKYNWLQRNGYTTCERELASAYSAGIKIFDPRSGRTHVFSVWSRPLPDDY